MQKKRKMARSHTECGASRNEHAKKGLRGWGRRERGALWEAWQEADRDSADSGREWEPLRVGLPGEGWREASDDEGLPPGSPTVPGSEEEWAASLEAEDCWSSGFSSPSS